MRRSPELQCESGQPALDRPDQDFELQQARDIPRNLQVDETKSCSCPVRVKVAEFRVSLRGWLRSSDIGCVEVETGLSPDAPPGARPHEGYDPAMTSLAERQRAKAAELGVSVRVLGTRGRSGRKTAFPCRR